MVDKNELKYTEDNSAKAEHDDDVDWESVWYDAADEIGMFDDDDEEGK
jgi:hypothetical protein